MTRWLRVLGKWLLTAAIAVALWWTVDLSAVGAALRGAHWGWIGLAVVLLPVNLALDGWVWARLLRGSPGATSPRQVGAALFCGFALGFWTPARLGEYAGRAFSLPEADPWSVSVSVFAQRMVDMLVGVGVGLGVLLGTLYTDLLPASAAWSGAALIGVGTTAGLGAAVLAPGRCVSWVEPLSRWVSGLAGRLRSLRRLGAQDAGPVLGGTVVRYFVFTGQFVCLSLALAPDLPPVALCAAVALTFYAKYLIPSLTLLDLGIREGGAVLFFEALGLPPAVGLSAALLLFTLNVLLPAAGGLPFVWRLASPRQSAPADEAPQDVPVIAEP
jgi:uncharacterized membrane protein YbhN (UPF0104 family)